MSNDLQDIADEVLHSRIGRRSVAQIESSNKRFAELYAPRIVYFKEQFIENGVTASEMIGLLASKFELGTVGARLSCERMAQMLRIPFKIDREELRSRCSAKAKTSGHKVQTPCGVFLNAKAASKHYTCHIETMRKMCKNPKELNFNLLPRGSAVPITENPSPVTGAINEDKPRRQFKKEKYIAWIKALPKGKTKAEVITEMQHEFGFKTRAGTRASLAGALKIVDYEYK